MDTIISIIILLVLVGYIIIQNKKIEDLKTIIIQNEVGRKNRAEKLQKEVVSKIDALEVNINNEVKKYETSLGEKLDNTYNAIVEGKVKTVEALDMYSKELFLQNKKLLDNEVKELRGLKGQVDKVNKNIEVMEEIFRLQLVNSLLDDAENAMRIYKKNVSNK